MELLSEPSTARPRWRYGVTLAWRNDNAVMAIREGKLDFSDDNGLTNDANISMWIGKGNTFARIDNRHRMITEEWPGLRRWDEGTIDLKVGHRFHLGQGMSLTLAGGVGLAVGGNMYGDRAQNFVHKAIGFSHLLGNPANPLQFLYGDINRFAATPALSASFDVSPSRFFGARAAVDAQLALGNTGRSEITGTVAPVLKIPFSKKRKHVSGLEFTAALSAGIKHTADPHLTIPGGYRNGQGYLSPAFTAALVGPRFSAGYQVSVNTDGTGSNTGLIFMSFGSKQSP